MTSHPIMTSRPIRLHVPFLRSSTFGLRTAIARATRPAPEPTSQHIHKFSNSTFVQLSGPTLCRQARSFSPRLPTQQGARISTIVQTRFYSTSRIHERQETFGMAAEPIIQPIFETMTSTFQYIVTDPSTRATVIIDPVLDFDPCTSGISTKSADAILSLIQSKDYKVNYILETHVHADHLSAASYLQTLLRKSGTRPQIGIGKRITQVQKLFGQRYGVLPVEYNLVFDKLLSDDEVLTLGSLRINIMHLPGHTPDHIGYAIASNVFCGDSIFHPSIGTARADFPGGSIRDLWSSTQKLLDLPDETRIWAGHDYPAEGREPTPSMTVKEHKAQNRHVGVGVPKEEFVEMRAKRDKELGAPRLLHQSLQVNVRGGRLPEADEGGRRMLSVPLKIEGGTSW